MRAEFRELDAEDRHLSVDHKVDVYEGNQRVAVVSRFTPNPDRHGGAAWYVCSCWLIDGLTAQRRDCEHIQHVRTLIDHAEPGPSGG